jgi:uncharacterized membrane protein YccC
MSATAQTGPGPSGPVSWVAASASGTLPFGFPALFYGIKVWAAACLALFLAFRFELPSPSWAGTTAVIVCQPAVGAALSKGWVRMVGTVVGAIAMVLIAMAFPQSRGGFLLSVTIWSAACAIAATLLRGFSSYGAALAGFTSVIIATDIMGATGGASDTVLQVGINRATEILLGIACGTGVLAATDLGSARRQLAVWLWRLSGEAAAGLCRAVSPHFDADAERLARRQMLREVSGLSGIIGQAAGEISAPIFRPWALQGTIDGLIAGISAWRVAAVHREMQPQPTHAARVLDCLPVRLAEGLAQGGQMTDAVTFAGAPAGAFRHDCAVAVRRLLALPAETPSGRLLAEMMARGFLAIWLATGDIAPSTGRRAWWRDRRWRERAIVPDYLPPLLNGVRAFVAVGVAVLIWIVTAWPNAAYMIVFAAASVLVFAPLNEAASSAVWSYLLGSVISVVLGAVVAFGILPARMGFPGFAVALALVLIPVGTMAAQSWRQSLFGSIAVTFVPLLGPANAEVYDATGFFNNALALVVGIGVALLALRLMPPLTPAYRARRLLALTLRDLRQLTCGRQPASTERWRRHVYVRMGAMTDGMALLQHARMAAALAVGNATLRLRRLAGHLDVMPGVEPVLTGLRQGDTLGAVRALERLDADLHTLPGPLAQTRARQVLRMRVTIIEMVETLRAHRSYFDSHAAA